MQACEKNYRKSNLVHSILCHIAETIMVNLEDLYTAMGWPLYCHYGHAYDAFKLISSDPTSSILDSLTREVRELSPDGEVLTTVVPALTEQVKEFPDKEHKAEDATPVLKDSCHCRSKMLPV
jgi:translation initiation factor 2 subunit 1